MAAKLMDRKTRVYDIQANDTVYIQGNYVVVLGIEHDYPMEGMCKIEYGQLDHSDDERNTLYRLGDDSLSKAVRSGAEPQSEWVEVPMEVKKGLPLLVKTLMADMADKDMPRMMARGPLSKITKEDMRVLVRSLVWVTELSDDEDLQRAGIQFETQFL